MDKLINMLKNEPVAVWAFINALFGVLAAFGIVELDDFKKGAIFAVFNSFVGLFVRNQVTPINKTGS